MKMQTESQRLTQEVLVQHVWTWTGRGRWSCCVSWTGGTEESHRAIKLLVSVYTNQRITPASRWEIQARTARQKYYQGSLNVCAWLTPESKRCTSAVGGVGSGDDSSPGPLVKR